MAESEDACPVCAAAAPPPFLVREDVPVFQNLPGATAEAARAVPRGRLAMAACESCGFVWNRAFAPGLIRYDAGYDNAQAHSPRFVAHLESLVRLLVERRGVRGVRIVEVGCGQGDFLRRLVDWPASFNSGTGFDPACRGPAVSAEGRLRLVPRLYGPDCADAPADVVVCRHVIEHVADPLALLRSIRAAAPAARVFFETPCVAWVLRHRVTWDFFYEHCSLFAARSLAGAFARAGYAARRVRRVFAGQYLWLEATPGAQAPPAGPGRIPALARAYAAAEAALLADWRDRLAGLAKEGPVAVWGAGAKGATFAALADPCATAIACLVDINPGKQGRFLPGTAHPIVAPADLAARGVRNVVLMNPAYRREIAAALPHGTRLYQIV